MHAIYIVESPLTILIRIFGHTIFYRTAIIWLAAALLGSCFDAPADSGLISNEDSRPNIVVILVDDMGWSDIGVYGGEIETPQIDELAANGLRFTQFHTTAKCFPSRAALLTGRYPRQVGMHRTARSTHQTSTTVADVLRSAGYQTFMVGKHHALDNPLDLGFDRYTGLRDGAANHFNPGTEARTGEPPPARKSTRAQNGRWWCNDRDCVQGFQPKDPNYYSTDFFTSRALEYLDSASHRDSPFFLYVAYQAPHDPLQAWPQDIAKYTDTYQGGFASIAEARYRRMLESGLIDLSFPRSTPTFRDWNALTTKERDDAALRMAVYAAMTDRIDQNLKRLVDHLRDSGDFENTIILFTSDNGASAEVVLDSGGDAEIGEEFPIGTVGRWASLGSDWANVSNTPFRNYKNYSYEGGTASPMIIHWPVGISNPDRVTHANAHLIDIFPTLLAVSGTEYTATTNAPLEGVNLTPLFKGDLRLERDTPIFQRWNRGRSVRTGRWKITSWAKPGQRPEDGKWELYDMTNDRTETRDLAAQQTNPDTQLATEYDNWLKRTESSK